ncbi:MAG: hypothetical protein JKY62_11000 [Desulfocapsa sp.]|nr:hypothetical protein [Desulfocapsa sp.]MBN4058627.1 hypothetical protein [Desulfocapsa sp. AH-315-J15]
MIKARKQTTVQIERIKLRKHLNADALLATMKTGFEKIEGHRPGNVQHSPGDTLTAGFSMFSLKNPSLLAFDERRQKSPHNLMTIYVMGSIPCDTSMREILDGDVLIEPVPFFGP